MHILFLTQVLPYPLDAGPKIRAYYLLRYLAQYHKITLVSFVRSTDTPEAIAHLHGYCDNVLTCPMPRSKVLDGKHLLSSLITGQPFIIARDQVGAMFDLLDEVVQGADPFDAIHADQLWMAPYALHVQRALTKVTTGRPPITVLDQHNAVYLIPQRMAGNTRNPLKRALLQLESQKLARYEVECCRHFDHVLWVTDEDYQAVQNQAAASTSMPSTSTNGRAAIPNSGVIPICVDVEEEDEENDTVEQNVGQQSAVARRVTFLGGLHYPPNAEGVRWFAENVFPKILARVPDAIFTVIGKQPPDLGDFGIPQANLEVTGYVADPLPYLEGTAVFIVPLHAGGGMRVKILDAWRWGLPIVSTTVGAEGLRILPGENILLADDPEAFSAASIRLLTHPEQGNVLARAGRAWVKEHYFWRTTYQTLDKIYPHAQLTLSIGGFLEPSISGISDISRAQPA